MSEYVRPFELNLCAMIRVSAALAAVPDMFEERFAEIVVAIIRPLLQEFQQLIRAVAVALSDQRPDQNPSFDVSVSNMNSTLAETSIAPMTKDSIPRHLPLASIDIFLLYCTSQIHQPAAQFPECHIQRLNSIRP